MVLCMLEEEAPVVGGQEEIVNAKKTPFVKFTT